MSWEDDLIRQAAERETAGLLRRLPQPDSRPDFSSNDYLGLAENIELHSRILAQMQQQAGHGTGGSRLLAGNSALAEQLETELAVYHGAEAGLLFGSGFMANVGLFAALATRHDTILYDELVHASMRDGIRLSLATAHSFRHNDLDHLRQRLQQARGRVLIAVEGLYSMDGDLAPLEELATLCHEMGARLVVDEAHSNGLYGPAGCGLAHTEHIRTACLARLYTFGKALGCHGAVVVGSQALRTHLINHARSFIFTTAQPLHSLIAVQEAYRLLPTLEAERQRLFGYVAELKSFLEAQDLAYTGGHSPIFGLLGASTRQVRAWAERMQQVQLRPILHPTVPQGQERIRICLRAGHTPAQLQLLQQDILVATRGDNT